ncbi:MAG: fibronectin type III domain-containing protein, partial [Cyclobacteriaceae bacterium]|nr:fibronectin type III domain-containing protein [Cyclobacteriaceae bacterium]
MHTRIAKQFLTGLFLFIGLCAHAQVYPVTSHLTMAPPYPINPATYAMDDFTGMQLHLVLTDQTRNNYLVGLRLIIEGQSGIRIETIPSDTWMHTTYLNPGNNAVDLALLHALFNPDNLLVSGMDPGGNFPEGMYRFKVEVYDINRNVPISDPYSGMHVCWISRFEPPILSLPTRDAVLAIGAPNTTTAATFAWIPRGVYPGITNVEYTLEIAEIYDENIAPEDLFAGGSNNPMSFSLTTPLTSQTLVFPTAFAGMQPDKWYAWRVRAHDLSNKAYYRNDGYSAISKFYYGTPCPPIGQLSVSPLNDNSAQVTWDATPDNENYLLQFRNKTLWGNWINIDNPIPGMELANLAPGVEYEFRLSQDCGAIHSAFAYAEYTNPGILNIDCQAPYQLTAQVQLAGLLGNDKLMIEWEKMPGAIEYQIDVRNAIRTLSQQTTQTQHAFRWGEKGLFGDTLWIRTASRCWQDSAFVFGDEQMIVMSHGGGGTGCRAPSLAQVDSAVTYPSGITEVYWTASSIYSSYTLLWRPAGVSAPYLPVHTSQPSAIIQGLMDGDSVECRIVYHCALGSDTTDVVGFRTYRASQERTTRTGSCYEPSYLQAFVPGHTRMQLVWEPEPNAQTYEINWKKEGDYIWNSRQVNGHEALVEGLEENATYVYRVRTVCENGIGFSRYTDQGTISLAIISLASDGCPPPDYEGIDVYSPYEAGIAFVQDYTYTGYAAEYRLQSKLDWTQALSRGNTVVFTNLAPETTYEVRVRGNCNPGRSEYTLLDTFTTPAATGEALVCDAGVGNTAISNTNPIAVLLPGNRISASGWTLYIKQVTEANGIYNGSAYAQIPYLQHSMVEFTLENARINTDSTMYAGRAILKGMNVQLIDPATVERIEHLLFMAEQGLEQAQKVIAELQAILDLIPKLGDGVLGADMSGYELMEPKALFQLGIADLTLAKDTLLAGLGNVIVGRELAQSGVDLLTLAVEKALANLLLGQELAPLDSCVTFVGDPVGEPAFDAYRYPGSEPQYTLRRTFDNQDYEVPYKSFVPNASNTVRVVLPGPDISPDLMFKNGADQILSYTDTQTRDEYGRAVLQLTPGSPID